MSKPAKRSRVVEGSCWNCRRRRVKCDLLTPCSRCYHSGSACGYGPTPFKWVGGAALRGRNASGSPALEPATEDASNVIRSSSSTSTSAGTGTGATTGTGMKITDGDSEPPNASSNAASDARACGTGHGGSSTAWNSRLHLPQTPSAAPVDENRLIPYFTRAVLPRFLLDENSMYIDEDYLRQDNTIRQALLAISHAHFDISAKRLTSRNVLIRNHSRHLALASFRKRLEDSTVRSRDAARGLFSTNVLFCILDGMIEPCNQVSAASSMHLKGGFAMLDRWSDTIPEMIRRDGMQAHLLSLFVTMDLVQAMMSGRKPYFESNVFHRFAGAQGWWGRLASDDRLLTLLSTMSELVAAGSLVKSQEPSAKAMLAAETWISHVEAQIGASRHHDGDGSMAGWHAFCDLYELCARIYVERALRPRRTDDAAVQELVKTGLAMLTGARAPATLQHCLVLPMLVVGAHCVDVEDQVAVARVLTPTVSFLSFGSLPVMLDFLRATWERDRRQINWWDMFDEIACNVFLF